MRDLKIPTSLKGWAVWCFRITWRIIVFQRHVTTGGISCRILLGKSGSRRINYSKSVLKIVNRRAVLSSVIGFKLPVYIYVSPTRGERSGSSIDISVLLPDSCCMYLEVPWIIQVHYFNPNVLYYKLHFIRLKPSGSFRTTRFKIKLSASCPHGVLSESVVGC